MPRNGNGPGANRAAADTSLAGDDLQRSKIDAKTLAVIWCGRLPVRQGLRPAPHRSVVTRDVVPSSLIEAFPGIVDELNAVIVHVRTPEGWEIKDLNLREALAFLVEGEA
jgi:hypothetical protein